MSATPYPLPRETRESTILIGNGTVGPYGPSLYKIFDILDVAVFARAAGEDSFTDVTDQVTVTKTADAGYDTFSVLFDTALPVSTEWYHQARRVAERSVAVTRAGTVDSNQLEKELSKQATVESELRRDVDRNAESSVAEVLARIAADLALASLIGGNYNPLERPDYDSLTALGFAIVSPLRNTVVTGGYALAGDGGGARYKRVAVEPTHAGKKQSLDGAWWEIAEAVITPQMFGVINDTAATDQTVKLQAWLDTCGALGKPVICTAPAHVRTTDTLTFPSNVDIDIEKLTIIYHGPKDRKVLFVPFASVKILQFGRVEGNVVDWTSDDYVGIYLQDILGCRVFLNQTRRFTRGYGLFAPLLTPGGTSYNRIWPGRLRDNKYAETLKSLHPSGFINQNTFIDGDYGNTSASTALGEAYATHVTAAPGAYNGHNNNCWVSPTWELTPSGTANRVPMFFDGAGGYNKVIGASRAESNFGPIALFSGSNVRENDIELNFASTATAGQLNTIQEVNGANSNRLIGRYGVEVRTSFNNLHRLLSSNGGANGPYVRGDVFIMDSTSGLARRSTTIAGRLFSNALGLELGGAGAVMVAIDTSKIKQWRMDVGYAGDVVGSALAIAFDAAGNRLTGDAVDPLGNEKYIKNQSGAWAATASFGGGYIGTGFNGGQFSVRPEVQTMWIGIASATVRSFGLVGYSTQETLGNVNGLTSIAPFVPLDDDGSVPLASADPGAAGTHGYYSRGTIVYNSAAASGQPGGWQCTTAGWLAGAWTISTAYSRLGRITLNGGNAYKLVTPGTSAGAGGPTGTGTGIVDGTCVWDFAGVQAVFTALANLP